MMSTSPARTRLGLELLAVGLAGGIIGDLLLRGIPWGVNVTLCTAALVGAAVVLARHHKRVPGPDAPWLAITALLLSAAFLRRDAEMLAALDTMMLIATLALGAASLQGERLTDWRIADYVRAGISGTVASVVGSLALVFRDVDWKALPHEGGGRLKSVRAAFLGVLLATPLLLIFAALFASADEVFANILTNVFAFDAESVIQHMVLTIFWGALVAGYLRWTLLGRPVALPAAAQPSLGVIPVATALGLINALFLLFVVVQLRYFFGGAALIEETTGLTYATYARRGFFELVTASALVLPILLLADHALRNAPAAHVSIFRRLAGLLVALLAVVMASALERMRLYVAAYGLSEDRLYATAFMILLVGVLVWFAWTVLRGAGSRARFAFGTLMQGLAVLAGLHVLNPDAFIVRTNLNRPAAERPFDAKYAVSLGGDAVPALIDALPRLDPAARCVVASGLLRKWDPSEEADWRTWNWSRSRARKLVRERAGALQALACKAVSVPE